jgi:hypothetical protein
MNKPNAHILSIDQTIKVESERSAPVSHTEPSHRILVLIPPDSDCASLTRRICKIASETNSDIQLLGLYKDIHQEMSLRRDMATVAALIRYSKVFVETRIETGRSWVEVVKRNYQPGDTILCISEPSVGFRKRPLSEILESSLQASIYVLSETKPEGSRSDTASHITAWSGFLAIIIGFFVLQMKIVQLPDDWFQTTLSILSLVPELGLILLWNSLF